MKKIVTLLFVLVALGVNAQTDPSRGISPPVVSTNAATSITANGAILNGTVNPQGSLTNTSFEFGTTTAYGSMVTGSPPTIAGGNSNVATSYAIAGALIPNTMYHFRASASNGGGTGNGNDMTFTTAAGTVCTPDAGVTSGMGPASANVPCILQGVPYSQTYTFVIPAQATSVTFDSVKNLPTGLAVGFSQIPPVYTTSQTGCMLLTGISNAPCGQYQMQIYVTVVTQFGTQSGELSVIGGPLGFQKTWLRVIQSGGTCPAINTAQTTTFAAGSCTGAVTITLNMTKTDVACFSESTGSATVTASGGSNYTYLWNNNATTATISNLPGGTYTVTVTEGSSTASASVTIDAPASGLNAQPSSTNTACGQSTGTASVNPNGGTPGYTFLWSTNATTSTISNLAAGNYMVTVTDSHNCNSTATITVSATNGPSATALPTNAPCASGTGSIMVTTTGGTGNISYLWNNNATTQNLTGVTPGTYTLTITDANNCSFSLSSTVGAPPAITITGTTTNASGGNNGAVNVTVTGGTGSLSYAWSNNSTNEDISNLAAGTYQVTVTDQNTCTATAQFTVTSSVGISGVEMVHNFSVFPNPASSSVNIKASLTETADIKVELFDVTGKLLISENAGKVSQLNYVMNTSAIANGIYMLRVSGSKFNVVKELTITK